MSASAPAIDISNISIFFNVLLKSFPVLQSVAPIFYSLIVMNPVGLLYSGITIPVNLLIAWILARVMTEQKDVVNKVFDPNFYITSMCTFMVFWSMFLWEQYSAQSTTIYNTMIGSIAALYLLTFGMCYWLITTSSDQDWLTLGILIICGTAVAVGSYYLIKWITSKWVSETSYNQLYATQGSLAFVLAVVLTPVVLGASAIIYWTSSGSSSISKVGVAEQIPANPYPVAKFYPVNT